MAGIDSGTLADMVDDPLPPINAARAVAEVCHGFANARKILGAYGQRLADMSHAAAADFYANSAAVMAGRDALVNAIVGEEMRRQGKPYTVDSQWSVRSAIGVPHDVRPLTNDDLLSLCLRDDARHFPASQS
jgi:hypothetical protein